MRRRTAGAAACINYTIAVYVREKLIIRISGNLSFSAARQIIHINIPIIAAIVGIVSPNNNIAVDSRLGLGTGIGSDLHFAAC